MSRPVATATPIRSPISRARTLSRSESRQQRAVPRREWPPEPSQDLSARPLVPWPARSRVVCLGKAGGEYIDPTTADSYLRDNYASRPYVKKGDSFETHVPAYQYGGQAEAKYGGKPYEDVEAELMTGWPHKDRTWDSSAVRDGYERSCAIRKLAGKG